MQRLRSLLLGAICAGIVFCSSAYAQTSSFKQTNLVSDSPGLAANSDPDLLNPWGVAFFPGQAFWISNNNSGTARLFDRGGSPKRSFTVPPPRGSSNQSTPTGIVANRINGVVAGFNVSQKTSHFIFATEDGTISGWNGVDTDPILAVDNSAAGAVYKGLAIIENDSGDFVLATNFNAGSVEAYNSLFSPVALFGAPFVDPTLPSGFAPFGIQVIANNQVVVTFAQQDALKHDPLRAPGAGFVSLFDANGGFIRRIASRGTLNAPWGVTIAPLTFGSFPGALLVGNFGDGTINAFNLGTGAFLGQLRDSNGAVIATPTLWNLLFDPSGTSGDPNTLYITAGLADEKHGLFAAIVPNTAPATPDFTIGATPPTLSIAAGQPAPFTVTVSGFSGFNSAVNLSCSGLPLNSTCSFSPASVTPLSGGAMTSTMNIMTNSSPYHGGALMTMTNSGTPRYAAFLMMAALALFALLLARSGRYRAPVGKRWILRLAYSFGFFMLVTGVFAAGGCGYGSGYNTTNTGNGTQRGTTTVMITGTSGNLIHSFPSL